MPEEHKPTVRDTTKFEGPKVLIAVKSCMRDWMQGCHEVIRETWGSYVPKNVDLKFFWGNGAGWLLGPDHDEIHLDVSDEYLALAHKTKAIATWAFERDYEFAYLCDNDTFIKPKDMLESGFQNYDWSGHFWTYDGKNKYFHGGYGYFLSRQAMSILAGSKVGDAKYEDGWVGDMLYKYLPSIVSVGTLPKFSWHFPKDHYPSAKYNPKFPWQEMMTAYHLRNEIPADREWDAPVGNQIRRVKWNLIPRTCK